MEDNQPVKSISEIELNDLKRKLSLLGLLSNELILLNNSKELWKFCDLVCKIMNVKTCVLGIIEDDNKNIRYISNRKEELINKTKQAKLSLNSINKIIENKKALAINGKLAAAIHIKNKVYGFFYIENKLNELGFHDYDGLIMSILSSEIAIIFGGKEFHEKLSKQDQMLVDISSQLKKFNLMYDLLLNINDILKKSIDIEDQAGQILKLICVSFDFDMGEIWLFNKMVSGLQSVAKWENENIIHDDKADKWEGFNVKFVNSIYEKRESMWILNDLKSKKSALSTAVGTPLIFRDHCIGVMIFFIKEEMAVDQLILNVINLLAARLGELFQTKFVEDKIKYILEHDQLTGLLNRAALEKNLNSMILRNPNKELIVIMMDIDKLKVINDVMGYYVGDQVIQIVSDRLKKMVGSEGDLLAKIGADKFLFVLHDEKRKNEVIDFINSLLKTINEPISINNKKIVIKASAGIGFYPADGRDCVTLLRNTDAALSFIKGKGGNYFQFCQPIIPVHASEKFLLINDLREAIKKNQFLAYYQPKVDVKTGEIVGVEALLRWQHPERGLLYPIVFMSLAEETELIIPISELFLREIFSHISSGEINLPVAVNLSIIQFRQQYDLVSYIKNLMNEFNIHGEKLEYEITENIMMLTEQNSIKILNQLKSFGSQISFDDFGIGYSSFSYLKYFTPDKIKIDKSFIDSLPTDFNSAKIVQAMISLAHTLNVKTIAEGVTTAEQLKILTQYGCDQIQGYYFSRALPLEEFILLIKNGLKLKPIS